MKPKKPSNIGKLKNNLEVSRYISKLKPSDIDYIFNNIDDDIYVYLKANSSKFNYDPIIINELSLIGRSKINILNHILSTQNSKNFKEWYIEFIKRT